MSNHLQDVAFHACRALEALEDPRDGDDDVEVARMQHLFGVVESLARVPASCGVCGLHNAHVTARLALCQHLRNNNAKAISSLKLLLEWADLKPFLVPKC